MLDVVRICFSLVLFTCLAARAQTLPAGVQGPVKINTESDEILYSFPDTHNPNPIGGRLYLQPLGPHPDKVVMNTRVELQFQTSAEYNPFLHGPEDPNGVLNTNTTALNMRLSHGFKINGAKLEIGGVVRSYWDDKKTFLSVFLGEFHKTVDVYRNIPPKEPPLQGTIGENHTVLISDDGDMYITTVEAYTKLQIFDEKEGSVLPNLAMSFHLKIPTSGRPYDKPGVGVSLGLSKHITEKLIGIAAISVACQDLEPSDFNSSNIEIRPCNGDAFAGIVYDFGDPGGWYTSMGLTLSQNRVRYPGNPENRMWVGSGQLALFYQSITKRWEWYMSLSEGALNQRRSPYPDFTISSGFSFRFDSTRLFDNKN